MDAANERPKWLQAKEKVEEIDRHLGVHSETSSTWDGNEEYWTARLETALADTAKCWRCRTALKGQPRKPAGPAESQDLRGTLDAAVRHLGVALKQPGNWIVASQVRAAHEKLEMLLVALDLPFCPKCKDTGDVLDGGHWINCDCALGDVYSALYSSTATDNEMGDIRCALDKLLNERGVSP